MVQVSLAAQLLFAAFSIAAFTPERIPGAYMIEFDDSQVGTPDQMILCETISNEKLIIIRTYRA
jgi:hypothetical protein